LSRYRPIRIGGSKFPASDGIGIRIEGQAGMTSIRYHRYGALSARRVIRLPDI